YGCPIQTATIPAIACKSIKNSALQTVVITSGDTIGEYAFIGCDSLTSVTIPDSVTTIGYAAFYGCPIQSATIPAIACKSIKNSALQTVVITSGDTIGDRAFQNCRGLTSVTISNSVTTIGNDAFSSCGLISITLPDSVTMIGRCAFYGCDSLTSVVFEDTSAWYSTEHLGYWHDKVNGISVNVSDEEDVADYLRNSYDYLYKL
ncbi:MAG: leucine-rich repeat domain-containing protein, partial [Clostridiales bacterium]|nr:leucine-rich repeat domain-containing protein [Clostridiales bacterium]